MDRALAGSMQNGGKQASEPEQGGYWLYWGEMALCGRGCALLGACQGGRGRGQGAENEFSRKGT